MVNEPLIRLATIEDLDALTDLHVASFKPEHHVPMMLGKRYVRATYKWHIKSPEAYVLIADIDHKVVGLVGMCDKSFFKPMFMACLGEFILSILTKPGLLFKKEIINRLFRHPKSTDKAKIIAAYPGMAQMTIGAVDAGYRGVNIFPKLVEATKTYSKERGSRAIRAGVYKKNAPSRKVFIKLGWPEMSELESEDTVFYVAFLDPLIEQELANFQ